MQRKRLGKALIVLPFFVLLGATVIISGFYPGVAGNKEKIAKELNLSDEQKSQIKEKLLETQKARIELEAKMRIARLELQQLLEKDEVDVDAALKKVEEIGQIQTQLQKARIYSLVAIKKTLTPEQRKKWQGLKGKFREKVRKHCREMLRELWEKIRPEFRRLEFEMREMRKRFVPLEKPMEPPIIKERHWKKEHREPIEPEEIEEKEEEKREGVIAPPRIDIFGPEEAELFMPPGEEALLPPLETEEELLEGANYMNAEEEVGILLAE